MIRCIERMNAQQQRIPWLGNHLLVFSADLACKDFEARKTKMAASVRFSCWFGDSSNHLGLGKAASANEIALT